MTSKLKLTIKDFEQAAKKLRCEIACIRAVDEVESHGKGFYSDGFPTILFERHIFRKYTNGKFNKSHPHLSGAAGNYGAAGQNQRNKFNEAYALDPQAAMKSCSWGRYQIMGFNYSVCGFRNVGEFVDAMKISEGEQLLAFCNFVIGNKLDDELRNKQWAAFAKGYNGAGYKKNQYDTKLAAAYKKYSKNSTAGLSDAPARTSPAEIPASLSDNQTKQPTENTSEQPLNQTTNIEQTVSGAVVTTEKNEQSVNDTAEVKQPEPQGVFKKLSAGVAALFSGTAVYTVFEKLGAVSLSQTVLILIIVAIVVAFLGFVFWAWLDAWKSAKRVEIESEAKTNINKKDLVWK